MVATTEYAGISLVTTDPEPTTHLFPIFARISAPLPIQQSSPIVIFSSTPPWSLIGISGSSNLSLKFRNVNPNFQ